MSRIYFVIIYYSPLKTNNSAIFFAMLSRPMKFLSITYPFPLEVFSRMFAIFQVRGTRYMVAPIIMFSSLCLKSAVRSFLNLLTPAIAKIIAPFNIYSIKFVQRSFQPRFGKVR